MLGTKMLHDILSDRETIANQMEAQLDHGSAPWGIKIERVEMYVQLKIFSSTIDYF
jgi:erythrocyte band 7 integral membrane protein